MADSIENEATCIGCGCTEFEACQPDEKSEDACYWLVVDRRAEVGVCSRCPEKLLSWDAGVRAVKVAHG